MATSIGEDESQAEATIELYLAGNAIKRLPRELFALKGLTVLSLREFYRQRNVESLYDNNADE